MKHRVKTRQLARGHRQRLALLRGLVRSLVVKNKIKTTLLMTSPGSEVKLENVTLPQAESVPAKPKEILKKKIISKTQKTARVIKKIKKASGAVPGRRKKNKKQKMLPLGRLAPVFNNAPSINQPVEFGLKKISIMESPGSLNPSLPANKEANGFKARKPIRRTALDIKKAEELKENEQSMQEKEWEIPAFLRLKK